MANNINITDMGTFPAGAYENIKICGMGTCTGPTTTAQQINIPGLMKFEGSELVKSDIFKCTGMCTISGKLKTAVGTIHGELKINELEAQSMLVHGLVKSIGNMRIVVLDLPGALQAEGDLQCESVNINGSIRASNFKTGVGIIHGAAQLDGRIEASFLTLPGALKSAFADIKKLAIDGDMKIEQNVTSDEIKGNGSIMAQDIEADSILFGGALKLSGQLSADIVDILGVISAKEIVGDQIKIGRPEKKNTVTRRRWLHGKQEIYSEADLIEATRVELYRVKAKQVNGQDIIIGENCKIDRVDCSGTLSIAKDAVVGQITGSYNIKEQI